MRYCLKEERQMERETKEGDEKGREELLTDVKLCCKMASLFVRRQRRVKPLPFLLSVAVINTMTKLEDGMV